MQPAVSSDVLGTHTRRLETSFVLPRGSGLGCHCAAGERITSDARVLALGLFVGGHREEVEGIKTGVFQRKRQNRIPSVSSVEEMVQPFMVIETQHLP